MARIAGVSIPSNKRVEIALTYIKGIGNSTAIKIVEELNIDRQLRVKDLDTDTINTLRRTVENNHKVEGDLTREVLLNVKRLKEINSYRGTRHAKRLPARGQRTKTNSRTVRGNARRTMGSGRVKAQKT
jgi:small subunit ribosomal protein S13